MSRVIHFEIQASQPQKPIEFYSALLGWKFEQWGANPYGLIETEPAGEPGINGVGWLAYIKDPDGNILGLMQSDSAAR